MRSERFNCDNCGAEFDPKVGYVDLEVPLGMLSNVAGLPLEVVGGGRKLDLCNGCTLAAGQGMSRGLIERRPKEPA